MLLAIRKEYLCVVVQQDCDFKKNRILN